MTSTHLLFLGLGSTSAVGIHAAVQWWGAYRVGVPLLPSWGWRNLEIRSVIGVAMPSSIYAALGSVSYLGLLVVAGSIPGGTVAFQIGLNFFHLPIALCARPVAAAQLPLLARNFDQGHLAAFSEIYRAGLAFTAFIALPASLLFCGIAETLARAISFGGMAGPSGIALVAAAVGSLSLGIIGDALFIVATSASYARRDAATPLQAMVVRAALIFAGIAVALWAMPMQGTLVLWALGMSASAANLVSAAYLHGKLKRVLSTQPRSWIRRLLGNFAAASGAAISGIVVADWLANTTQTSYERVGVAVAAVLASSTCYLTVQRLRNSEELRQLCAGALPGRSPELVLGLHRQSDVGAKPSATDGPP
jgi:putative peptidoglycan lipid II flippase